MSHARAALMLPVLLWLAAGQQAAFAGLDDGHCTEPEPSRYALFMGSARVGTLAVVRTLCADRELLESRYRKRQNDRGPVLQESIKLDRRGRLLGLDITGSSSFGRPVEERYRWSEGAASWSAATGQGQANAPSALPYVPEQPSPLSRELIIRQVVGPTDAHIAVLPHGGVRAERLGELDSDGLAPSLSLYLLSGLSLDPEFVVVDGNGRLVASRAGREWLLLERYLDQSDWFADQFDQFLREQLAALVEELAIRADGTVVYDNVHVLSPVTGAVSQATRVTVRAGRIVAIGLDAPADEIGLRVDAEGGYLLPGLYDMHVHSGPWTGLRFLAAGIVGVRDQGSDPAWMSRWLQDQREGRVPGPRVYPSGLIEGRSDFSIRSGRIVASLEQAISAVDRYASEGYGQIKLYSSISPEWVAPLARHARELGLSVTGHVPAFMTADQAIIAGYDDISHLNQLMLGWVLAEGEDSRTALRLTAMARLAGRSLPLPEVDRTLGLLLEHDVAIDTTAVILERVLTARPGQVSQADAAFLHHLPLAVQRNRSRGILDIPDSETDQAYRQAFEALLELLGMAHRRGVRLLPGTDDVTGLSLHRELELYAMAGMTPAEALSAASLGAATHLGLDGKHGSIEPGKWADFLLLADNPMENLAALRTIRLVSIGKRLYRPDRIHEVLGIRPFASAPTIEGIDGDVGSSRVP